MRVSLIIVIIMGLAVMSILAGVDEALDLLRGIDMHSDIGAANHYLCEAKLNVGLIEGDR